MIRKIPLSDHYYKESEIDDFLDEKSDKTHGHGDINKDGQITANTSSVNKVAVTDSSNSIKTIDVLPLNKVTHQDISGKVNKTDIQDNFSSTAVDKPLSANKGTELKNLVDTKANSNNVYSKAETMSASDIRQAIADGVGNIDIFEVVSELPTSNIKGNKFYLTPNNENINKNIYDINIYVDNNWETIDSLEFDISNYPTTSEVTILLNGKVDIVEGKGLSSNDFTDALKNKLENNVLTQHQSLANYVQKSQTQGLIKNDGTIDTNNYLTKETAPKIYNYGFVDSNLVLHLIYIDTEVSITKTIIQTGGSSQITILVTDEEGNPLEDIPVDLYANGVKVGQTVDTNANGLSIHTYTGSGSGKVELTAKIGSVVSGTLPVFDCYKYDEGLEATGHHNDIWTIQNGSLNRDTEYSILKESTVGTTLVCGIRNIPFKNYRVEGDVYQVDGTQDEWCLNVLKEDYTTITSADAKLGEWKHISLDLNNIAPNSKVRLNTGGSCTELRFKNFMLYPYGDNDVISINASNPVITNLGTTNITGTLFVDGVIQKNTNIDVYKNGTKVDTISTGSTGTASYTYTGSGAGATEFQFKYGSILSEIFVIKDCIYYDPTTSDTSANYFSNTTNNDIAYSNGYIVITSKVTGTDQLADLRGLTDNLKGKTVNAEFEVDTNGMTGLVLRTLNLSPNVAVNVSDGVNTLENVVIPSDASGVIFRLIKPNSTSGQSFKFKNVKIYSV